MQDLEDARTDSRIGSHFLGPLVLLQAPRRANAATVYDGFHRVVTTAVLLKLLANRHPPSAKRINTLLRPNNHPRVLYPTPGRTLTDHLAGRRLSSGQLSDADRQLRIVIDQLAGMVAEKSEEEIAGMIDFLLNKTFVSVTTMASTRVAFRAFVTANDRGMRLNQGDLLKGYLVDFIETQRKRGGGQSFAQAWTQTQRKLGHSFVDFLKAIHLLVFDEHADVGFAGKWLDHFDSERGVDRLINIVHERFPTLAGHFAKFIETENAQTVSNEDIHLFRLTLLPWRDWQAPALLLMYDGADKWPDGLKHLAQACWIIELQELSAQRRAKLLSDACHQIQHNRSPFENIGMRGEKDFFGALTFNWHNKEVAKQVLMRPIQDLTRIRSVARWLESMTPTEENTPLPAATIRTASVEHILPRHPRAEWADWSEEDQQENMHRIGNVCLIPYEMNQQIENRSFTHKTAAYRTLRPNYVSAHEVASYSEWSAHAVEERTGRLAELACEVGLGMSGGGAEG